MKKIWHIDINGVKEGPYSIGQLRNDKRITPDTLVWKKGFPDWVPIRNVRELDEVFKDEKEKPDDESNDSKKSEVVSASGTDLMTLALRQDPPYFYLWVFIAVMMICYLFYQLSWFR